MKTTFLAIFILLFQTVFCQSDKLIQGKITSENFSIPGIDIINLSTNKSTVSDTEGKFNIVAKSGDILLIGGKNYYTKKLFLKEEDINQKLLQITIKQEIIELETVEITKEIRANLGEQKFVATKKVDDLLNSPTNQMVYNGSITDGLNLIQIGKLVGSLFKGKDKKTADNRIIFSDFVAKNFDTNFYLNTLKLKEEEIPLYLEFCNADSKSETIAQNNNILEVTDFLIYKKEEFRKLKY